jgi:hypothetical protein
MIFIENKKRKKKALDHLYPNAEIIDVTSKGKEPYVRLSPFYPHGGIPVPFTENIFSNSVEGIWQGLKVFEKEDIDLSKFEIQNMKGLKRTVRKFGKPLGHRKGINGIELLDYLTARFQIYLKSYAWVLQNKTMDVIELLKTKAETNDLVFLDYGTNGELENIKKPLSHAALVKKFIEKKYPEIGNQRFTQPIQKKVKTAKKPKKEKIEKVKRKRQNKKSKSNVVSENQISMNLD